MSETWKTKPPYPNWKSFATKLAEYVQQRADDPRHQLPRDTSFAVWFQQELPGLRERPIQREKNTLIAFQFLPLFEAEPAGWESLTSIKLGVRDVQKPLATHLAEWQSNVGPEHRPFVAKLSRLMQPTIVDR